MTIQGLDALPRGSVVVTKNHAWRKDYGLWFRTGSAHVYLSKHVHGDTPVFIYEEDSDD